uniref:Uncharacterized protein n=1 Tax=Glossina austeni TaxID=7395 RepID=A0A1A9V804_GLOAU
MIDNTWAPVFGLANCDTYAVPQAPSIPFPLDLTTTFANFSQAFASLIYSNWSCNNSFLKWENQGVPLSDSIDSTDRTKLGFKNFTSLDKELVADHPTSLHLRVVCGEMTSPLYSSKPPTHVMKSTCVVQQYNEFSQCFCFLFQASCKEILRLLKSSEIKKQILMQNYLILIS